MKFYSLFVSGLLFPALSLAYTFDQRVPQNIQTQIRTDLGFVETIQSETQSDLHKGIFGGVSGDAYSQFFNSRVNAIGLNSCGSPNAVACVIPAMNSSKMWLTQNYIKFSHPQIARLMVVFHEARHTETQNGFWSHAHCPEPFNDTEGQPIKSIWTGSTLAGQPACDTTAYGSYGSSLIMLKNISKFCTNCGEKVKMDAGIYADDQLKRIIDKRAKKDIEADLYHS